MSFNILKDFNAYVNRYSMLLLVADTIPHPRKSSLCNPRNEKLIGRVQNRISSPEMNNWKCYFIFYL